MKKLIQVSLTVLFIAYMFALVMLRGQMNYDKARFYARHSDGSNLGIATEMQKFGFCQDGYVLEEPYLYEYFVSGIGY